jgi:hypothetical protein
VPAAPPTSLREHKLTAYRDLLNLIAVDSGAVGGRVGFSRTMKALQDGFQALNSKMWILMADDECPSVDTTWSLNGIDDSDAASCSTPPGAPVAKRSRA